MARPRRDPVVRFWERVDKSGDCWLWMAGRFDSGYGAFHLGGHYGKQVGAHRFAYELLVGPIPPGLHIDHRCHNRACVNPQHLRLATVKQNQENRTDTWRGIYWNDRDKFWYIQVRHNGEVHTPGRTFKDFDDALEAARLLRNKLYTHNDIDRDRA